ncbi:MAG: nucleotidyltransferase domain-containing protein [Nitrospirae bacterium]|nr:nucleotidyltransferase domain-containing protein [Nitrospirota bacterium]
MPLVKDIKLTSLEEEIIQGLTRLLEKELPEAKSMILFGSRARGGSDEESDMDLAIVLDLPMITRTFREKVWQLKWDVLGSLDAEEFPLSILLLTYGDFINRNSGIEGTIKREGVVLWERN